MLQWPETTIRDIKNRLEGAPLVRGAGRMG
jgi:hypothetical protein